MSAAERLIRYCKIDTQSDPANEQETPSSKKQFDLANLLVEELKELGLQDVSVDEHCYVYAKLPSKFSMIRGLTPVPLKSGAVSICAIKPTVSTFLSKFDGSFAYT